MSCKPLVNLIRHAYSRYKYVCANILALTSYFRQYYWRCDGLGILAKICSASPTRRDNAYSKSCNKRKRKYLVLQRNGTFKFKITPDRHNAIQNLNYCLLPGPPLFSLPSTFKVNHMGEIVCIREWQTY
jgi:hypothetical protein